MCSLGDVLFWLESLVGAITVHQRARGNNFVKQFVRSEKVQRWWFNAWLLFIIEEPWRARWEKFADLFLGQFARCWKLETASSELNRDDRGKNRLISVFVFPEMRDRMIFAFSRFTEKESENCEILSKNRLGLNQNRVLIHAEWRWWLD